MSYKPVNKPVFRTPIKCIKPNKVSPKLVELCRWHLIKDANFMLDHGKNAKAVHDWVIEQGFSISLPMFYDYAKLRKQSLVEGVSMEHMLGVAGKPLFDQTDPAVKTSKDKLKSEIDALDFIIQRGYQTLYNNPDEPITPGMTMAAIKLKNELTDGNHGFLTNYGMEHLRDIENAKYRLIIEHLISYIPEGQKSEAVNKILDIEDSYYQTTDYYEEYLRASGEYSESEIQRKLEVWKENRNTTLTIM